MFFCRFVVTEFVFLQVCGDKVFLQVCGDWMFYADMGRGRCFSAGIWGLCVFLQVCGN